MKPLHPFHGLAAATPAPFKPDGSLNLAVVEQQAEHLLGNRITIAFINGSTGECQSLALDERLKLAERWFEVTRGTPLKVSVHVGSNCLGDSRMMAAQAEKLGAVSISAFAPSYFKPANLDVLVAWCAEIAASAPNTPFYFYDIPLFTHVTLPMSEFVEKAVERLPTLAGLKFTNSDLMAYQLCLHAVGGRLDVPYGFDECLLAALALGARGAVGSTYNFAAPIYQRLMKAFVAGDLATAREAQFRSVRFIHLLARYGFIGAAKATMAMAGVDVGPPRLPNVTLTPEQSRSLGNELESMGFFDWIRPVD